MKDLVLINEKDFDVTLDIRYATKNNVTQQKFYENSNCCLHKDAVKLLENAIELAKSQGLRFKIFDGFRPLEAQKFLFDKFPNGGFVSNPETGSIPHCRGVAIDLTLIDKNNNELEMGTTFDDFTNLAHHGSQQVSIEAQRNRFLLMGIMTTAGWDFYRNEWWHYQLFNPRQYLVI